MIAMKEEEEFSFRLNRWAGNPWVAAPDAVVGNLLLLVEGQLLVENS